jgi:Endonuclease/Exonuclease/phosphatase family
MDVRSPLLAHLAACYNYAMRLATWNCQPGLDSNWNVLEELNADVLTVQECGLETPDQAADHGWTCEYSAGGYGKGVAVLARSPYRIETRDTSEHPFVVSTVISGPDRFRFAGFWAMTEAFAGYSYTRQATLLIEDLPDDGLPTVVAGDFNAAKSEAHFGNVRRLGDRGLVSAYHGYHHLDHGATEPDPTSYFQWKKSRPYHMDFVFVPSLWPIQAVDVGTLNL